MTRIYNLEEIRRVVDEIDIAPSIEEGFVAYSRGEVVVPPVGELIFEQPPGDTHIKYGYIRGDDFFVIKIASGFYENFKVGLPSGSGLMLLFSQKTGVLESVLLDEGYLTDVRTAAAGRIAAQCLAPGEVRGIGVFGTGVQARMQVRYLRPVTDCKEVTVWGRSQGSLDAYKKEMDGLGYRVRTTLEAGEVAERCNLIITATPSKRPLITADLVQPGTHITAMGSDTPDKQELDPAILKKADIVVADSIEQCLERGEIFQAIEAGMLDKSRLEELGSVIADSRLGRASDDQITVADLTGVAVQDVQIAKAVHLALQ